MRKLTSLKRKVKINWYYVPGIPSSLDATARDGLIESARRYVDNARRFREGLVAVG